MPRTPSEVIDLAVRENRFATSLLYAFSVTFVLTGIALIVLSVFREQPITAIAGVADGALFWPAVKFADKIRRSNIMLRTLEIPLNKARTAEEATAILQLQLFESHFVGKQETAAERDAARDK